MQSQFVVIGFVAHLSELRNARRLAAGAAHDLADQRLRPGTDTATASAIPVASSTSRTPSDGSNAGLPNHSAAPFCSITLGRHDGA